LRAATEKQLGFTLANWVFPAGNQPNNFIFDFVATDHGCNNAFEATAESGDGGDAIEDGGDYGEGDGDDDIYP
jgi:hypothetical protein